MYLRPETELGGYLLGGPHPPLHLLSQYTLFSISHSILNIFSVQFGLAVMRSVESLRTRPLSPWKLMLRDGLNLYGVSYLRGSITETQLLIGHLDS